MESEEWKQVSKWSFERMAIVNGIKYKQKIVCANPTDEENEKIWTSFEEKID